MPSLLYQPVFLFYFYILSLIFQLFAHTDEGPVPPFAISFYQEPPSNFNKSAAPDPLQQEKPSSKRPRAFIIACLVI